MATQVPNTRLLRDGTTGVGTITKVLPGTGASNTTDTIDLGAGPYQPEEFTVEIAIPAIAAHVTAGNHLNITLWHSDTNGSLAVPVSPVPTVSVDEIGIASTGTAGSTWRFRLPIGTKRYIGFRQVCGATDDLSGSSIVYSILT
jgi:hypothetical protein